MISIILFAGVVLTLLGLGVAVVVALSRRAGAHPRVVGCPECGHNMLPEAASCPNCGRAMN